MTTWKDFYKGENTISCQYVYQKRIAELEADNRILQESNDAFSRRINILFADIVKLEKENKKLSATIELWRNTI